MEEVRLYFTALKIAFDNASPSSVPIFFARCTKSIWSILLEEPNSLVSLLALDTFAYSLFLIRSYVSVENSANAFGIVFSNSARSTMESVVDCPRSFLAQVSKIVERSRKLLVLHS